MATNRKFKGLPVTRDAAVASGVTSGAPCVDGQIPGVALVDRKSDGRATIQCDGSFLISVKGIDQSGNSAVAEGDILYFTAADTPPVSKKNTGVRFGYAEGTVGSSATATISVKVGY